MTPWPGSFRGADIKLRLPYRSQPLQKGLTVPNLYITFALPNPMGKDRARYSAPSNGQLNGEWLEFGNVSSQIINLSGVVLSHYTFDSWCQQTGEGLLDTFKGNLDPGYSIRFHSGSGQTWQEGRVWHLYIGGSNYVWNNGCGDTALLRDSTGAVIDWASYAPNPPEGQVLRRLQGTNRLV